MLKIIQEGAKVLRGIAKEVPVEKIKTPEIQSVLSDMKKTLASEEDGVALAAPQINVPLRIFVVSGKVFIDEKEDNPVLPPGLVFINPKTTKLSRKKTTMDEGCLSVVNWYGKVNRAEKATVQAYDEKGVKFERGGSDLLAQIFQHEIDHLDGILFIDKAKGLEEIKPEDIKHKHEKTN